MSHWDLYHLDSRKGEWWAFTHHLATMLRQSGHDVIIHERHFKEPSGDFALITAIRPIDLATSLVALRERRIPIMVHSPWSLRPDSVAATEHSALLVTRPDVLARAGKLGAENARLMHLPYVRQKPDTPAEHHAVFAGWINLTQGADWALGANHVLPNGKRIKFYGYLHHRFLRDELIGPLDGDFGGEFAFQDGAHIARRGSLFVNPARFGPKAPEGYLTYTTLWAWDAGRPMYCRHDLFGENLPKEAGIDICSKIEMAQLLDDWRPSCSKEARKAKFAEGFLERRNSDPDFVLPDYEDACAVRRARAMNPKPS